MAANDTVNLIRLLPIFFRRRRTDTIGCNQSVDIVICRPTKELTGEDTPG